MNEEQKKNTEILIQVLEEKIKKNEPEEILDSWFQPCGTHGCVAGHYVLERTGYKKVTLKGGTYMVSPKDPSYDLMKEIIHGFESHFGFSEYFYTDNSQTYEDFLFSNHSVLNVIGPSYSGTLQERLTYVKKKYKELS